MIKEMAKMMLKIGAISCVMIDNLKSFEYDVAVVAIAKNEADYILEWIEYHRLIGINKFYIYDNDSIDGLKELLNEYIQDGVVEYIFYPGANKQLAAYRDSVNNYKNCCKYMAFIDCDEFIYLENDVDIVFALKKILHLRKDIGGIALNWRIFGSSSHQTKPEGLVIESYLYRGETSRKGNECIKTIANPRFIKAFNHVHYPIFIRGLINVDDSGKEVDGWSNPNYEPKIMRINHYFTKSKEEWIKRRNLGKADTFDPNDKRSIHEFYEHDYSDIFDCGMLKWASRIKKDEG